MGPFAEGKKFCQEKEAYLKQVRQAGATGVLDQAADLCCDLAALPMYLMEGMYSAHLALFTRTLQRWWDSRSVSVLIVCCRAAG